MATSALWIVSPAAAQNECGAPASSVVTCSVQASNNFPDGISYTTATDLLVNVGNNLVITPDPGVVGVNINTTGAGTGDATINFNGNMTGSFTVNNAPSSSTAAAVAAITNGNSTASSSTKGQPAR